MCKNPQVNVDGSARVTELMGDVAAAVGRRVDAVRKDVYETIVRDIPQLREDKPVLALLASSVDSNVETCLQVVQYRIDLDDVRAPAAAVEYARRLAQRGTPLTALLRAYRVGHACFADWLFKELALQAPDAEMMSAATVTMSKVVAGYIDRISEQMVTAYAEERENWLRNRSAARASRIRDLLSGERIEVSVTESTLGYRLRQYHVGLVCWVGDAASTADEITRLERAISHVASRAALEGEPLFLPRDESSAWAWLPLGIRDTFDSAAADTGGIDADIHFAFGDAARGSAGFRLTHQQALAAQAVALASGSPAPRAVAFGQVAPVAMMLAASELLRPWVLSTLADLAGDDEHHARLRETLLVFLRSGGSYKTTAQQLTLHKNTVQYRIRKAEESLGRPVGNHRPDVELALQASHWLGSYVLRPVETPALPEFRPDRLGVLAQRRDRSHRRRLPGQLDRRQQRVEVAAGGADRPPPVAGAQLRVPGQLLRRSQPGVGDPGRVELLAELVGAAVAEGGLDDRGQRVVMLDPVGVRREAGVRCQVAPP